MKTYTPLWEKLCSWQNLTLAYEKAQLHKTRNPKVQKFAEHAEYNLALLRYELRTKTYTPQPLQRFVLRDPKTRLISVSDFRDRVVHHALINILQPIFEPRFIYDSFASRKGAGTLAALQRFDVFKRKATKNGTILHRKSAVKGFVFKADIYHYFDTVDHEVLLNIIRRYIKDDNVLWLVRVILNNHKTDTPGKGMPLGNWTSQFFANIYLNELDQFVKHQLKAKYYLRYVDDFIILDPHKSTLQEYEKKIKVHLEELKLTLHPTKCKITALSRGTAFVGFRIFYHHKTVRERNKRTFKHKLRVALANYELNLMEAKDVFDKLNGWNGYAMQGNTYRLREQLKEWVIDELIERTKRRQQTRSQENASPPPKQLKNS